MHRKSRSVPHAGVCLAWAIAAAPLLAADDSGDAAPVRCLSMSGVQTTRIVNDGNILFFQRNGHVYLNVLDQTCVGLSRSGKFTYSVQTGARTVRLCDADTITVLETVGRGFTCGLGRFYPVSKETADGMLGAPSDEQQRRLIRIEPAAPKPDVALPSAPSTLSSPDAAPK
jgi:hypothetical protein